MQKHAISCNIVIRRSKTPRLLTSNMHVHVYIYLYMCV